MSQSEFLTWCDDLTVAVRLVEDQVSPPAEAIVIGFSEPPAWNRDEVATALLDARDHYVEGDGFYLEEQRSYFSWGADAAAATVILTLAGWAAQGVVGDIFVRALKQLWAKLPETDRAYLSEPVDRREAEARCRWAIERAFASEVGRGELDLLSETERLDDGTWSFSFGHSGVTYSASLAAPEKGLPLVTTIIRTTATGHEPHAS